MIVLLSPAKSLDFSPIENSIRTEIRFQEETNDLIKILKKKKVNEIRKLMNVSDKIANLNFERFQEFSEKFTPINSKQSIFAFTGDVYKGLEAETLSNDELEFTQNHLRILSGLYGVLRPMDAMQPYRLEMGTRMPAKRKKNLYEFWGDKLINIINADAKTSNSKSILNLASNEYAKAVNFKKSDVPVYSANFKEYRGDDLKFISFNAKKARGFMSKFVIQNKITDVENVKSFDTEGYSYSEEHSSDKEFIFVK